MHGGQSSALRFLQGCCMESTEQDIHSFLESEELCQSAAIKEMKIKNVSIQYNNVHCHYDRNTITTLSRGMNAIYGSNRPNDSQLDSSENDKAVFTTTNLDWISIYHEKLDQWRPQFYYLDGWQNIEVSKYEWVNEAKIDWNSKLYNPPHLIIIKWKGNNKLQAILKWIQVWRQKQVKMVEIPYIN